ncbi:MAG: sensor histidine kinase [Flavobacteriales bacterium]|nr:sensor histidine kinase [Flavobacteriales bacterium]
MKHLPWKVWPFAAALIAIMFTAWDISLMDRAQRMQQRLADNVELLDHLSQVGTTIDQLATAHRHDRDAGTRDWAVKMAQAHAAIGTLHAYDSEGLGLEKLERNLLTLLHNCDSLHTQALSARVVDDNARMSEAVIGVMAQQAGSQVEAAVRNIHKAGLGRETAVMNRQWSEVQWMLMLAGLFAMACALLAAWVARVLYRSRERSKLLARTGVELERAYRELRETMLSKEEKEVMLKEIHHRVKNNLQIVRSLIRFQTDKVEDPRTLELFNECVNRVGAMALVHEQTYLSKDLANIDVTSYLNCLVRDLVSAYNIRLKLHMDVDIQVKTLGVDTLTPLGLLINEVISNSFKHAFNGRDEGTIIVHLSGTEQGGLYLRLGDDGIGLPDRKHWEKPKSLGMELIKTLAGQLDATLELEPGPGTVFELRTIVQEVRKRA